MSEHLPEDDSVPDHDVVVGRGGAHSLRRVLLQPVETEAHTIPGSRATAFSIVIFQ